MLLLFQLLWSHPLFSSLVLKLFKYLKLPETWIFPECCVPVLSICMFALSRLLHYFKHCASDVLLDYHIVWMCSVQREFYQTAKRKKAQRLWPSRTPPLCGATNRPLSREATAAKPPVREVRVNSCVLYITVFNQEELTGTCKISPKHVL